jgi:hypothetical protein
MTLLFFQYVIYIHRKITALRKGEISEAAKRFELKDIDISEADIKTEEPS